MSSTGSSCKNDRWSRRNANVANGFCSYKVPVGVSEPRSIVARKQQAQNDFVASDDIDEALVLERGTHSILHLQWNTTLPLSRTTVKSTRLATIEGLNHGLAWTQSHIYASTATTVYRWTFQNNSLFGDALVIVDNIHEDGQGGAPQGHTTRTLEIHDDYLYISVGSYSNIDESSYRSRIRRFPLSDDNQTLPMDFRQGEVFADGLRNEVAMEFDDSNGILYGVGNSGDNLFRADLGGDIHNDNPAEEVHQLQLGDHYGYPFCWREYSLEKGLGKGTAWAWPSTMDAVSDEDCRNQFDAPIAFLPAHSAPLGITFYRYNESRTCPGVLPFPPELDGYAFIAYHGSWNRDIPTGYKVVYMDLRSSSQNASSEPVNLLRSTGCYAQWKDRTRPVDVAFDACGRLWITSDGSRGRGSHLIVVESSSATLLKQPSMEVPCAWRLPVWAISLVSVVGGIVVVAGVWWMLRWRKKRYEKANTTE